jgi:LPPG:FO 2-phospho-L-lactate transferase
VGAAKFVRGLVARVEPARVSVVVNTGDDEVFYGLHVSPDVDTITYTLAGAENRKFGWGLAGESFNALAALERFFGKAWFGLGDKDIATHLFRTMRMHQGASLTQITAEITRAFAIASTVLPMSDDRVRTFVKLRGRAPIPFQEYFVRGRARGAVEKIDLRGIKSARPSPAVMNALRDAQAIVIAPSNPFVSVGPIIGLPRVRDVIRRRRSIVAAISPIVSGRTIKGPAVAMMRGLGMEASALGVARLYRDIASVFVIDRSDAALAPEIERLGMRPIITATIMSNPARAAHLAGVVLQALGV